MVTTFGIDPIHFGLIVVFALSLGTITPPVGNVLFVGARVAGLRVEPVIVALVPFFLVPARFMGVMSVQTGAHSGFAKPPSVMAVMM